MPARYYLEWDIPHGSADGTLAIFDGASDAGDVYVHVDPYGTLTRASAQSLGELLVGALNSNSSKFVPHYPA